MGKNIWITGASSGIGKSLTIKFADKGWNVAVSARRENLLQDLCKINSNNNEKRKKNIPPKVMNFVRSRDNIFLII